MVLNAYVIGTGFPQSIVLPMPQSQLHPRPTLVRMTSRRRLDT